MPKDWAELRGKEVEEGLRSIRVAHVASFIPYKPQGWSHVSMLVLLR